MQNESFRGDVQTRLAIRNEIRFGVWQNNPDVGGNSMKFLFAEGPFAGVTVGINQKRDADGKETFAYYVLPSHENSEHHVPASGDGFQTQMEADDALMKYLQKVKQKRAE